MSDSRLALLDRAQSGDSDACEKMLMENSGLIWSVVRRYYGLGADPEDLYQLGCIGFIKAVKGFDITYGTQFSTYAVPKIAGEIRRFLRDDGTIKVSRSLKERAALIRTARQRLTGTLGREPTLAELSECFPQAHDKMCSTARWTAGPAWSPAPGTPARTALRWRTS